MIEDLSNNWAKPARVMVLDPPEIRAWSGSRHKSKSTKPRQDELSSKTFPIFSLTSSCNELVDPEVAFLSPVLAFNLGVYVSWLEYLTSSTPDFTSEALGPDGSSELSVLQTVVSNSCAWRHFIQITPFLPVLELPVSGSTNSQTATLLHSTKVAQFSRVSYATHVRIGLVRIPTENFLLSPSKGRQAEIDASLHDYFKNDRFLSKGDLFSIQMGAKPGTMAVHNAEQYLGPEATPSLEFLFFKVISCFLFKQTVI